MLVLPGNIWTGWVEEEDEEEVEEGKEEEEEVGVAFIMCDIVSKGENNP